MIGQLLSAGVGLFDLNFSHVAQAEHAQRQRAFAGTPDGGIAPSAICNMYHGAAFIPALVGPRRYDSHDGRYCDIALNVAILP